MGMVGTCHDVEGNTRGESDNEGNERTSLLQVLLELSLGRLRGAAEHGEGEERALGFALSHAIFFELVRVLSKHSHGNVMGATHGLGRKDVRAGGDLTAVEILGNLDEGVVAVLGNRGGVDFATLGEVDQHVVSTALVVRRVDIVVRSRVVLSLQLMASRDLLDSLNRVSRVGSTHQLKERSSNNHRAEDTNLLNKTTNGLGIILGSGYNAGLSLGDNEAPDHDRKGAKGLTVVGRDFLLSGSAKSVFFATPLLVLFFLLVLALVAMDITLVNDVTHNKVTKHSNGDNHQDT